MTDDVTLAMLSHLLQDEKAAVVESVEAFDRSLRDGEKPSEDELRDVRVAAEGLLLVVEEYATEVADGGHASRWRESAVEERRGESDD